MVTCIRESQSLFQQMVFCNHEPTIQYSCRDCHNPYFSRWFSAISVKSRLNILTEIVTILILVDGFLQQKKGVKTLRHGIVTILILVDGFLQYVKTRKVALFFKESQSLFQQMVFCNRDEQVNRSKSKHVTILILVDGFLQFKIQKER